jgi:hypothetical protein
MPNWLYLFTNLFYHLGLAIWIGGTLVLGALVAPALFRNLPRHQAGGMFGPILRRFARVRVAALLVTLVAAAIKQLAWESGGAIWIAIRWAALAFMAAAVVYGSAISSVLWRRGACISPRRCPRPTRSDARSTPSTNAPKPS